MKLKEEYLELLNRSNRTIAVVGKFSNRPMKDHIVFSNVDSDADMPLNAHSFFELVKPEICSQTNKTVTIGDFNYQGYDLSTPKEGKQGAVSQPIMIDSQLLSDGAGKKNFSTAEKIQAEGGQLFKELVESLDTVVKYSHSNFPKSLLTITRDYIALYVDANCEKGIGMAGWQQNFTEDHSLASSFVKYLTSYESDEESIKEEVKSNLRSNGYTGEVLENQILGLITLKETLVQEDEYDDTWQKLKREAEFTSEWLDNISKDKEYGFEGPRVSANHYFSWFNEFKNASDNVHRLIRSPVQHSFLFCFLSSKYKSHSTAGTPDVARTMYDVSYENVNGVRIYGESREAKEKNLKIVNETAKDFKGNLPHKLEESDTFMQHVEIIQSRIHESLQEVSKFTSDALWKKNTQAFITLSQFTGGPIARLHSENNAFRDSRIGFKNYILGLKPKKKNTEVTLEDYKEFLLRKAHGNDDLTAFVNRIIDEVGKKAAELSDEGDAAYKNNRLKNLVRETFVSVYTHESINYFTVNFEAQEDAIIAEENELRKLYMMRRGIALDKSSSNKLPMTMVTELPLFKSNTTKDMKKKYKEKFKEMAMEAMLSTKSKKKNTNTKFAVPTPVKFKDETEFSGLLGEDGIIKDGEKGEIVNAGQKIGTIDSQDGQITIAFNQGKQDLRLDDQTMVKFEGIEKDLAILDFNDGSMDEFQQDELSDQEANELAESYKKLSEKIDGIHKIYNEKDDLICRKTRSWVLGEYIGSAKEEESNLGKVDVSKVLGVMIDMIDHIGNTDNSMLYDNEPGGIPDGMLNNINLSNYYPVVDDETNGPSELSDILDFHYKLCQSVSQVNEYCREVKEIKYIFDAVGNSNLRIVFINDTLTGYLDKIKSRANLFFCKEAPSFVYLTAQASPQNAIGALSQRIQAAFGKETAKKLQIPMVVSDMQLNSDGLCFPLVSKGNLKLPAILDQKDSSREGVLIGEKVMQTEPYLMSILSLMVNDLTLFGGLKYDVEIEEDVEDYLISEVGKNYPADNRNFAAFFREVWLDAQNYSNPKKPHSHTFLMHNLIFLKWVNMALLLKANGDETSGASLFKNAFAEEENYFSAFNMEATKQFKQQMVPYLGLTPIADEGAAQIKISNERNKFGAAIIGQHGIRGFPIKSFQGIDWKNNLIASNGEAYLDN